MQCRITYVPSVVLDGRHFVTFNNEPSRYGEASDDLGFRLVISTKCATHVAWVTVLVESVWRIHKCYAISSGYQSILFSSVGSAYLGAYLLCVIAIYLDLKSYRFSKLPAARNLLSFLHAIDGISAAMLALAYYYKSPILLYSGILFMTK